MSKSKNDAVFFAVGETSAAHLTGDLARTLADFAADEKLVEDIGRLVIGKYSEKHRAYHNLSHIAALLAYAKEFEGKFDDGQSVGLAIWFHDVIYQPKSTRNEIESAKMAIDQLSLLNAPKSVIEKVEAMILATRKHQANGLDADGKLFLDLDLAILGADAGVYAQYSKAIRREYSFVPWFLYRRSRRRILENFCERDYLYFTAEMRGRYETKARANIAKEIKELS